jgi:glycosyltransferase involved in cell wall biosynthesis
MNGSYWGGSEELWYRTALWMNANGHEVGVCCYDWPEKKEKLEALSDKGATIYLLPRASRTFFGTGLKKMIGAIPFESYDLIVINQGGYKEVVYPPFNKLYKRFRKYVLCFHNYDTSEKLPSCQVKALDNWMQNAAMNVAAARKIFEVILKNFGISVTKKEVWVNPITFKPPNDITPYPALQNGDYIWTMLAELDMARKGQDMLVECLSTSKWKQRNWKLNLYGKGKDEARLNKLIWQHGLEEKIFLKGFTSNVAAVLTHSHLLLQCTRIDAMPLSVAEAMAMSRPCLVSNIGDMPYWVEDGKNGFVCNSADKETLDKKLEECWDNKDKWEELGRKAFESFKQKYPAYYEEHIANKLLSI